MTMKSTHSHRHHWRPCAGKMMTGWAEQVSPEEVLPEYPRPMMVRAGWRNLNGLWDYAIRPREEGQPEEFDGAILAPFAVESALSGVMKTVGKDNRLWYRRRFSVPRQWSAQRVVLHFGAVDWEATVFVNGRQVKNHRGGYDPFSCDITDVLKETGEQEIVVSVWDPTDAGQQPRGKQVNEPNGIWYTPVTGIWQTVWMEPVPEASIERIRTIPDIDAGAVKVTVFGRGTDNRYQVKVVAVEAGKPVAETSGRVEDELVLSIENARLWRPDSPFLYDLQVSLNKDGETIDEVTSYFGMRKVAVGKDPDGRPRLMLNNESLFHFGLLDQGWWPDGLYTAPTDEALLYDLQVTRDMGFNMIRKHVKVEPARFYYWCDRLGILVWQDMPSGDRHIGKEDPDLVRTEESAMQYEVELKRMMDALHNHPSIVMWVPFNEGWGQYDTERIAEWVRGYDPTRLVNSASGWVDRGVGDVYDIHVYPGPALPPVEPNRAAVLGEFGGLGLPVKGHTWQEEKNWGYRSFSSPRQLTEAYLELLKQLQPLIGRGLSAAVYTQTTDVEIEVNGLMTYDRAVMKMDIRQIAAANREIYD
jgi:beta-galactosidase/beta-glucuronidase